MKQLSLFEESIEEKIILLRGEIALKSIEIRDIQNEINELLKQCKCEHKVNMEEYTEGDYYNRAYTTTWQQCLLCGKKFDVKKKPCGWYS